MVEEDREVTHTQKLFLSKICISEAAKTCLSSPPSQGTRPVGHLSGPSEPTTVCLLVAFSGGQRVLNRNLTHLHMNLSVFQDPIN